MPSDTLFGDDLNCICFDHPNRETAMLSRWLGWAGVHRNVETLIRKSLLDSHQMSHSNQVLDLSCLVMAIYFRRCCVLVALPMLGLHIIILLRWKIDTGIVVIKPLNTNMTKA